MSLGRSSLRRAAGMAGVIGVLAFGAAGDVVYQTDDPFGGFFGLWGADVSSDQRVGARFTPTDDYLLDVVGVWFMNNDGSGRLPSVTVSIRHGGDVPSDAPADILESWTYAISAIGWAPMLEQSQSVARPRLEAGRHYWIVAESGAPGGLDPVWNFAGEGLGFTAFDNLGAGWMGGSGAALSMIVEGTPAAPVCVCERDGDDAQVNVFDLLAYLNDWFARAPAANLDAVPEVDVFDLLIFLACWFPAAGGGSCP